MIYHKFLKVHLTITAYESFTRYRVLKFLPEPIHELNILQKIFQDLSQYDNLVMQLTEHELA